MTDWEKQWMKEAPQDCLRTFRLNPNAPGGWSEYGETMLDLETTESLTDDNGEMVLSLLKADAIAPLNCGSFLRVYYSEQLPTVCPCGSLKRTANRKISEIIM